VLSTTDRSAHRVLDPRQSTKRRVPDDLALARTCYGHFAGRIAVAFWAHAVVERWVCWTDAAVTLLPNGQDTLARHGLLVGAALPLPGSPCLDWSERVPHVSGRLGIMLCASLLDCGWVKRTPGSRALCITARGEQGIAALGVSYRR
jgi:hypothetical protein